MSRGKQCLPSAALVEICLPFISFITRGPTDKLHPFTKSSETGLGLSTDSTTLLSGQVSNYVY